VRYDLRRMAPRKRLQGGRVSDERKLDSVERLRKNLCVLHEGRLVLRWKGLGFWSFFGAGGRNVGKDEIEFVESVLDAALTEMWDLSRREALREAIEEVEKYGGYDGAEVAGLALRDWLAVEEGK
jgi:hypothetical protein